MEELISKNSAKITESDDEICMSKIDLDYAYVETKLSKKASKHCGFSIICGTFTGHYSFMKSFYGLLDIPTVFQGYIDKVLELKLSVWLDDIICVTNRQLNNTKTNYGKFYLNYKMRLQSERKAIRSFRKRTGVVGLPQFTE